MKASSTPKKKSMGKKVGYKDKLFAESLREMFGNNAARRIMANPSAMKKAYGFYLKSRLGDFKLEYDEIPF